MVTKPDRPAMSNQSLVEFLDWVAGRYGPRPALMHRPAIRTDVWTYSEVRDQAHGVAAWLHSRGVGQGDRVVLWAPNSPLWVICFFGILTNGSIVVPLDTRSSADFVTRVVEQSEPAIAIASAPAMEAWTFDVPIISMEEIFSRLPAPMQDLPPVDAGDLAEIVFTSGTTGSPKGVMLSHGNIRSNVEAINDVFPAGPRYKPLSILPLSHLLEQTCGLLLALRGGTSIAYATALQPAAILRDMAQYRVTTMVLVPRILSLFMDAIEAGVRREGQERRWRLANRLADHLPMGARRLLFMPVLQRFGGRLTFLVTGGAALDPELERKWERLGIAVLQGYGSTETSPIITGTALRDRKPRSVGKVIPGSELGLLPDGEILVKGPNVMKGYWKNPEATAEVLKDGFYHTGDLGRLDAEGRLYLKGRKKNLIVLENGLNVFPEDVEDALASVEGIAEAVVLAIPSQYGPQVHAAVICDAAADLAALVAQANAKLASHQQVRSWERWTEADFPRTHTAKIKRAEVAGQVLGRGPLDGPRPSTRTERTSKTSVEAVLAAATGLPLSSVSDGTTLRELGLDARMRVTLGRTIEDRMGRFLDDSQVHPQTTVGELKALLSSQNPESLYPIWPYSRRIRLLRSAFQAPLFGLMQAIAQPRVEGLNNLPPKGPYILACRYSHLLDAPFALSALPAPVRRRLAISTTWRTGKRRRLAALMLATAFNSFRYSERASLHTALIHAAGLLDHRWSVFFLLRPSTNEVAPASALALALLAAEFNVPVVPVGVQPGTGVIQGGLRRGRMSIRFGRPLMSPQGAEPEAFARDLLASLQPTGVDLAGDAGDGPALMTADSGNVPDEAATVLPVSAAAPRGGSVR